MPYKKTNALRLLFNVGIQRSYSLTYKRYIMKKRLMHLVSTAS
ncbi:hypothetical protein HMPREF1991_00879 [Hoylesella loescheii DSM 19665 = JCM 12249 = ATCC 15930]|uniref:Uncharacterized protein n=1 Tax=Hoylesella loescheii DSM 19665 = JCM 12249 = ATCC 15930 TaxID=1122985 RepID=A0A069QLY1_HOYLO|nr:hypothetical protein HMPREF1991_00879 [Hoylesella loescheii DSM 19665 = JCM 12249 = ATCC 15930]